MMIIDLKYHFRLIRSSVEILMCKVKTFYNSLNSLIERPSDYKKATLMTVWYLSIMETLRQIGDSFDLSRGLAFRTIHKFIRVLSKLLNDFILWLKGSSITDENVVVHVPVSKKSALCLADNRSVTSKLTGNAVRVRVVWLTMGRRYDASAGIATTPS